jgi:hypothetical protein
MGHGKTKKNRYNKVKKILKDPENNLKKIKTKNNIKKIKTKNKLKRKKRKKTKSNQQLISLTKQS